MGNASNIWNLVIINYLGTILGLLDPDVFQMRIHIQCCWSVGTYIPYVVKVLDPDLGEPIMNRSNWIRIRVQVFFVTWKSFNWFFWKTFLFSSYISFVKGSVWRERKWFESILNPRLQLWDHGTGHLLFSRYSPHIVVIEFPFPVTTAQSVGILMRKVGMAIKTVLSAVSYSLWRR